MIDAPDCPECGRPLQRGRQNCIYCGYRLNEKEQKELESLLNDEAVREQTAVADAILAAEPIRVMRLPFLSSTATLNRYGSGAKERAK